MQNLTSADPISHSADILSENIEQLKVLFPEAVTEGHIDFDVLRQLLGGTVDDREEKYGLNWHGKRRARQLALTPSMGTLRPCPEESVDWATTQNLMIEGDNLEVLKLLQKSYSGKVKLIYIDPPYNTGNDFVYPDNFQDNIKNYLQRTGQVEGGVRNTSNPDTSGRFHTDWLNMMYPRLKLARNLLREDGVIFISIHRTELSNLITICNDIFGEENQIATLTWKARVKPVNIGEAKYRPQCESEFVVVYQKVESEDKFQPLYNGGVRSYPYTKDGRKYRLQTILKSNRGSSFRSTMSFEVASFTPPEGQRWQAGEDEIKRLYSEDYLEFKDGTPFRRYFEDEEGAEHDPFYCFMDSEWTSTSEAGKFEANELFGNQHGFDTVKPTRLIKTIVQSITKAQDNNIILDFFAGSGTTGHAIMSTNSVEAGNRRYILVQLPDPLDPDNKDQRTSADYCDKLGKPRNIAELTKERLRRAGKKIREENPMFAGDTGFRVFKLDSSNLKTWDPNRDDVEGSLLESMEHIKPDRNENDLLYELLLKLGLDLCVPMETRTLAGKTVHSIGGGVLMVCLAKSISRADAEPLALGMVEWHKALAPAGEVTIVFRDSAFADDVAKTNTSAILEQYGLNNVRSL
jgi:adenine-specific DNA-methyltransferase